MTQSPALAQAHVAVAVLVERFERNLEQYRRAEYNEADVRHEFIEPFFEALGWDVHNRAGYAEAYKDVTFEGSLRVGAGIEAPDYAFRVGGQRRFFVEAKKPAVNVKDDAGPAYQLRRYAWSAHLPLSLLTDFHELAVYDCTRRPDPGDKAGVGRVVYYTFQQYRDKLPEIWDVFAKESVLRGSFDRYAEGVRGKRGTSEVDAEFLKEMEGWRDALARNLALRNPGLSVYELNFAVQATIDRIVFLRVAEDRGIEEYGRLQALLNGANLYGRLQELYRLADQRYNAGLFDFKADALSLTLQLDDKVLKDILARLYYPDSPYEFSVLPVEILGQVYEQFLGKVIRLTAGHQAKVEEKPEVKKAGGVYYTPSYIVDYIVKHTVGELVEGRGPAEIAGGFPVSGYQLPVRKRASLAAGDLPPATGNRKPATDNLPLRILDPACGSGSFLLGAYQYLLDHCLNWYSQHEPDKWAASRQPPIYRHDGGWRLTTAERKRILLTHIFGVDIDRQAVEVTKLSLLLKVLEGESQETLGQQLALWRERALPNLDRNIQCGNSLIGPDYWEGRLMAEPDEMRRVNAFDWQSAFPEIFLPSPVPGRGAGGEGGFDAVIGNPPYIRIQTMKEWAPTEVEHYKHKYLAASKGNYDIYVVFVEKGLSLLNPNGKLGFILPHKFFNSQYGEPLRESVSRGKHLTAVVHFGHHQVFAGATTYTCMLLLSKLPTEHFSFTAVADLTSWRQGQANSAVTGLIPSSRATSSEWNFSVGSGSGLLERLALDHTELGNIADVFVGVQTSADAVFILDCVSDEARTLRVRSKAQANEYSLEKGLLFPLVSGTDVKRYGPLPQRQYILFPYLVSNRSAQLMAWPELCQQYPLASGYLMANKRLLEEREAGKFRDPSWYRFGRNQNLGIQNTEKLCVPRLVRELHAAYDSDGTHFLDNVDVGGVSLKTAYLGLGLSYLLGLLNSTLLRWYFPHVSAPFRGNWRSANRQFLSQLPIRTIDFTDPADVARHDRMVALVERMLELHKRQAEARTPADRELYARQIEATDREIDALVYELYGLTEEEIGVVEGAVNGG